MKTIENRKDNFLEKAKKIHGDFYDYSLVDYYSAKDKVKIICGTHGIFTITPNSHLRGSGCYECGLEKTASKKKRSRFDSLIMDMRSVHGNTYDYSLVNEENYNGMRSKVPVICNKHGIFYTTPVKHILKSTGCKKCANERQYIKDFLQRVKKIHKNYDYDYSSTEYKGMDSEIDVICNKHGLFKIIARYFLDKRRGCKKCSIKESNKSKFESDWLDYMGINKNDRNIYMKFGDSFFNIDGIDRKNRIIYEFYGDFFHGNPDIYSPEDMNPLLRENYGDLYKKTKDREEKIKKSGYSIISIWENEYKKQIKINKTNENERNDRN